MDPISDMFIRIKNAGKSGHESVFIPYSKFKYEIAKTLERSALTGGVEKKGKRIRKSLEIKLLYDSEVPKVRNVKFFSRPSRHLYAGYQEMPRSQFGGTVIVSTSGGVMTSEEARKAKIGGELIAEVW
jgi:small subunit ribosomal protein S8